MAELAKENGDVRAPWWRLKDTDLQITEWRGTSAFVFAPTESAAADYIQIALAREIEWRAGPIVNSAGRLTAPRSCASPSTTQRDASSPDDQLAGPVYRLLNRAGGAPSSISAAFWIAAAGLSASAARLSDRRWSGG